MSEQYQFKQVLSLTQELIKYSVLTLNNVLQNHNSLYNDN